MMLDFPTDWFPRKTILIFVFPVTVLTELFIDIQYTGSPDRRRGATQKQMRIQTDWDQV
jgi:hypothetical protein